MIISHADVYSYQLTYAHGEYVMSHNRRHRELTSIVVRLETDTGIVGWGEVCALGSAYLPVSAEIIVAGLADLLPELVGADPLNQRLLRRHLDRVIIGAEFAKSPIDMALWDINGQSVGRPVSALLGGAVCDQFPVYQAVPLSSAEEMCDFIAEQRKVGVSRFQLKVGNEPEGDIERIRAVAATVRPGELVVADANGGWTYSEAIRVIKAVPEDSRIMVEQPCPTLDDCLALAPYLKQPLVLDECILGLNDLLRAHEHKILAGVNLKTSRLGGLTNQVFLTQVAVSLGLLVTIEDMWGGDITSAAVAHVAVTVEPRNLLFAPMSNEWNLEHIAANHLSSAEGQASATVTPGLGVQPDLARLGDPVLSR